MSFRKNKVLASYKKVLGLDQIVPPVFSSLCHPAQLLVFIVKSSQPGKSHEYRRDKVKETFSPQDHSIASKRNSTTNKS